MMNRSSLTAMSFDRIFRLVSFLSVFTLAVGAFGRVGELEVEIEERYGKPLAMDHPVFLNDQVAALLKLNEEEGVFLWRDYMRSQMKLSEASADVRQKAISMIGAKSNLADGVAEGDSAKVREKARTYENLCTALTPKVYLMGEKLIQVIFLKTPSGVFSYSETYFDTEKEILAEENYQKAVIREAKKSKKIQEWFKLGNYGYRIDKISASEVLVGANDFENQMAEAISGALLGALSMEADTEKKSEYIVVYYTIRNEGDGTVMVLKDDFLLEDAGGRRFSPDIKATQTIIEAGERSAFFEQLQPGVETPQIQVFRLPADLRKSKLSLLVQPKGLSLKEPVRVHLYGQRKVSREQWSISPVDPEFLKSVANISSLHSTMPAHLKPFIQQKLMKEGKTQLPLIWQNGVGRVWLDFTPKSDRENLLYDLLACRGFLTVNKLQTVTSQTEAALQKASETLKNLEGF